MAYGKCKLCLQDKILQDSHLMPKALYEKIRAPDSAPTFINSAVMVQTNKQLRHHLLCFECEQLLNGGGESWLLPLVATPDGKFPFFDILTSVPPFFSWKDKAIYAAIDNPRIDVDKLVHFALGIFWKASVHGWHGQPDNLIEIGPYSDAIRAFLLGKSAFPSNIALTLYVIPPHAVPYEFQPPYRGKRTQYYSYFFYLLGLVFWLSVGKMIGESKDEFLYPSLTHPITVEDLSESVKNNTFSMIRTAKKTEKVKKYLAKKRDS